MTNNSLTNEEQQLKDALAKLFPGASIQTSMSTLAFSAAALDVIRYDVDGTPYSLSRQQVAESPNIETLARVAATEIKLKKARGQ